MLVKWFATNGYLLFNNRLSAKTLFGFMKGSNGFAKIFNRNFQDNYTLQKGSRNPSDERN